MLSELIRVKTQPSPEQAVKQHNRRLDSLRRDFYCLGEGASIAMMHGTSSETDANALHHIVERVNTTAKRGPRQQRSLLIAGGLEIPLPSKKVRGL
jgi:hypothetical protein